MSQIRQLKKEYEQEKLMDKIKVMGSLYGVPSSEISRYQEQDELFKKMAPMISKPVTMLRDAEISERYEEFKVT